MNTWKKRIAWLMMPVLVLGLFLSAMGEVKAEPQAEEQTVIAEDSTSAEEELEPESADPEFPADAAAEEPAAEDPADTEENPAPADDEVLMPRAGEGNAQYTTYIESLEILPDLVEVGRGGTFELRAVIHYKSGINMNSIPAQCKDVVWSIPSSFTRGTPSATVIDKSARTGTVTITVTAPSYAFTTIFPAEVYEGSYKFADSIYVKVLNYLVPITGLSLDKTSAAVSPGNTITLNPVYTPSNTTQKGLTWSSSNPSVATVDSNGTVTGVGKGTATITATSTTNAKIKATCSVRVADLCGDNVEWSLKDGVLTISGTGDIWDFPSDYPGFYDYRYDISSVKIEDGVTGIGTYTFYDMQFSEIEIPETVTHIENYAFSYLYTSLKKVYFRGHAPSFTSNVFMDTENTTVYYPQGDSTWTASVRQQYSGTNITWVPYALAPITGLKLNPTTKEIPALQSFTITPTFTPSNTHQKGLTWTSSNNSIATVDSNGVVTAKSQGSCTITATSTAKPSLKATCKVTVQFYDVTNKSLAAYTPIYNLAARGIVKGYGSYFDIDGNCTRAQFVLFLWRYAGKPASNTASLHFNDNAEIFALAPDYAKAIAWGAQKGIVAGFTSGPNAGRFCPNDPCTRGQVVLFLWRYKGRPAASGSITFKDASTINAMAPDYKKAILWAVKKGITTGFSDGTFRPNANCTRGQCVTFLYRVK